MVNSPADAIRNIPPVTRFFTISTMAICFAISLELIHPVDLRCSTVEIKYFYNELWHTYQNPRTSAWQMAKECIWVVFQCYRFLTSFLIPRGVLTNRLNAVMDVYFFYTFANHLESHTGKFKRNFPDCLWFTLVTGTMIMLMSFVCEYLDNSPLSHHSMMLSCVTYLWSRSSMNSVINFLGIVPIKAYYLPLFNLLFKLLVNGKLALVDTIIGIIGAYLYQCIQSATLPVYNIFPGAYSRSLTPVVDHSGRKVGINNIGISFSGFETASADFIPEAIFDKGYLKAPIWLYKLLDYPTNNSQRTTAFSKSFTNTRSKDKVLSPPQHESESTGSASGVSWFGTDLPNPFQGKGHRLGG